MDSSSQNTHEITSSPFDEDEIPIPQNLRFTLESLKLLTQHPLTQTNYLTWSTQIKSILNANGYTKYLDPDIPTPPPFLLNHDGTRTKNPSFPKYNLINQTLMTAILATISPSLQSLVLRHETVADIWTTIQTYLLSHTRSRMLQLRTELHTITMRGTDLSTYLTRVKSIYDELEVAGCHTDDEDMILLVMKGLPDKFDGFISAFRLKSKKITLPHFLSLLTTEALNLQQRHTLNSPKPHLALSTTHTRPPPTTHRNPNYKGKNPRPYYPHPLPTTRPTNLPPKTAPPPLNANFAKSWATPLTLPATATTPYAPTIILLNQNRLHYRPHTTSSHLPSTAHL